MPKGKRRKVKTLSGVGMDRVCGPKAQGISGSLRQHDRVDDVDDAVARGDIGCGDLGAVDADLAAPGLHIQFLTIDGLDLAGLDVGGHDLTGDDVVGEDGDELFLVLRLEEGLDGAGRELGEGFVGGGEHGEGALALEGFDQAGGLHGGDEGVETAGGRGDGDDVLGGSGGFGSEDGGVDGGNEEGSDAQGLDELHVFDGENFKLKPEQRTNRSPDGQTFHQT